MVPTFQYCPSPNPSNGAQIALDLQLLRFIHLVFAFYQKKISAPHWPRQGHPFPSLKLSVLECILRAGFSLAVNLYERSKELPYWKKGKY